MDHSIDGSIGTEPGQRRRHGRLTAEHTDAGYAVYPSCTALTDAHRGAKRLVDLGLADDAHAGEACHAVVVADAGWSRTATVTAWCTAPKRHRSRGDSALTVPERPVTEREEQQRDAAQATRALNAHRAEFTRTAIAAKLRSRDVLEFVLPVLFDTAGQTEKKDAARLLGIQAHRPEASTYPDYTTPLTRWAGQSPGNLTRAMLAIAYSLAVTRGPWNTGATTALAGWLDSLGYQPPPQA